MPTTMTQADWDYVRPIERRLRRLLLRRLRQIDRTGRLSWEHAEPLWLEAMIEDCGPRLEIGNPYNCYRLTDKGRAELAAA